MTWRNLSFWLKPGIRVKRYFALAAGGFLLALLGASLWPEQPAAALFVVVGAGVLVLGVRAMNRSVLSALTDPDRVPQLVYRRRVLARGPRVVAFGGGTGLSRLLKGLKGLTGNTTAVVATTDDGGSTGRLRREFAVPAVGDLVDCLAALSEAPRAPELMGYRFPRGEGLKGHTCGNLFLVALFDLSGDFAEAMRSANRILALAGAVWPSTPEPARLRAELADGRVVEGETALREAGGRVVRLGLVPEDPAVMTEVEEAIREAELLVLGPGSLFTSVIASLLPRRVREAVATSPAPLVQVVNIMTEPGETDGMDAFDHVRALAEHLGRWPDVVLVHTAPLPPEVLTRYAAEGQRPVAFDPAPFRRMGIRVLTGDFRERGPLAQHDPERLARVLASLVDLEGAPV